MKLKALVVNPWVADFKLYDEWMHPLGLYFLIDFLYRNNVEVFFYNCLKRSPDAKPKRFGTGDFPSREHPKPPIYKNIKRRYKIYGVKKEHFLTYLESIPKPDMVLFGSGMTYWIDGLSETVAAVSRVFPDVPVIAGGISALVCGPLLKKNIARLAICTASLFDQHALRHSGLPYLSGMTALSHDSTMIRGFKALSEAFHCPVLTSFGCPFSCTYCASPLLHGRHVVRPVSTILSEMTSLYSRFGVADFAFFDDALLYLPEKNFFPLMSAIRSAGIRGRFHTPNGLHVRWITQDILEAMKTAGFHTLRLGYETGAAVHNRETGNKTSRRELAQKTALIKKAGFPGKDIGVYVMAGLPLQTPGEVIEDMEFVASLGVKVKPVFLSPVPGTPVFNRYAKTFPLLSEDPHSHNDSFFITMVPGWDDLTVQEVIDRSARHNGAL
jgi:hypothetical protein